MASIQCKNGGTTHVHHSVTESKICYGIIRSTTPTVPKVESITTAQLNYIKILHGDLTHAAKLSKREASQYIDDLKKGKVAKVTAPVDEDALGEEVAATKKSEMIKTLIDMVPDGYFAVREQEGAPITFLRVKRPVHGKMKGALKVQSQHGPALENRWVKWPSDKVSVYRWPHHDIEEYLLLLLADWKGATRLYAEKIKKCGRCNASLTDPRSRFYLIGPECETKHGWGWWIEDVAAERGGYWEQQPADVQEKYKASYDDEER